MLPVVPHLRPENITASAAILLNGAFGTGKTTVAGLLHERLAGSRTFDPERIGWVLRRLPRWLPGSTASLDDYQNSALWRRLTIRGIAKRVRRIRKGPVIVPMCLTDHRDAIRHGLAAAGVPVLEVCLLASDATIAERLTRRGVDPDSDEGRWVYPRAFAAAARHRAGGFGTGIATDGLDPREVAALVLAVTA